MKDTNEIEKQLQRKADNYLEEKAQEIFDIYQEINMQDLKIKVITNLTLNLML